MAYTVEDTAASHQEMSITTLKKKNGNQITCESDFDVVSYTLRIFFLWIFTVDIIVSLTVLVQYYDLP